MSKNKDDDLEGWPPGRVLRGRREVRISPTALIMAAAVISVLAIGIILSVTGRLGVAQVADDEIAVLVNYLNGKKEVVTTPGFTLYLPFVQEIYLLDRSSQEFRMEGNKYISNNHVPRLTVRAVDGSPLQAVIRISPLGRDFETDEQGEFEVDIPPGRYRVYVSAEGYALQRRTVVIEENGVTMLNVDLRPERRRRRR